MKAKLLIFMTLLLSANAWGQSTVTGTVTDKVSGEGMLGVSVIIDGSGQGVFTGVDGTYSVSADPANDALTFSFVGYSTFRVSLNGNTTVNASLESGVSLDEVVVTALGVTREKKSLGYSVQELGSEAF
ncbi:MAG: carboxypeptidase-like regulatory domain-containing protein, partial [Flavobacteriales bacterium]